MVTIEHSQLHACYRYANGHTLCVIALWIDAMVSTANGGFGGPVGAEIGALRSIMLRIGCNRRVAARVEQAHATR